MSNPTSLLGSLASIDIGNLIVKGVAAFLVIGILYILIDSDAGTTPVSPEDVAANLAPIGSVAVFPPPKAPESTKVPEPAAETAAESTGETVAEPVVEAAAESTGESAVEPAVEAAAEPTGETAAEPAVEAVAEPTGETAAEPAVEAVAESTGETVAEPAVETAAKPADETSVEAVAEPAVEQIEPKAAETTAESGAKASDSGTSQIVAPMASQGQLPPVLPAPTSNTYMIPVAPQVRSPSRPIPTWGSQFSPMPPTR